MDPDTQFDAIEGETSEDSKDWLLINHGYANLIGSLMYLAISTWPDIAYLVNKLVQYTLAPKAKHWTAIKRVFRYLKGTRQHKLTYGGSLELLHDDINIYWLGIRFWLEVNQWLCNCYCRGSRSLELKETKHSGTLNTRSWIHCSYSHCQTGLMASLTPYQTQISVINSINYIFRQSISNRDHPSSWVPCMH